MYSFHGKDIESYWCLSWNNWPWTSLLGLEKESMNIASKMTCTVVAVFAIFLINPAVASESKPWSQSEVLKISDDLTNASRQLQIECRASPPKYLEQTRGRHLEFRYHVRHFLSVSSKLNNELEDGAQKDETQPLYEVLAGMEKNLNDYANTPTGAWIPVQNAVKDVEKYLTELGEYYK